MKTLSEGLLEFVMTQKTYDGVVYRLGNSVQTKAKGTIRFDIYSNDEGNYIFYYPKVVEKETEKYL